MLDAKERAAKGAPLLDRTFHGWHKSVWVWRLDLESSGWCVLGQIYGDFFHGQYVLGGLTTPECESHGFVSYDTNCFGTDASSLKKAWAHEIKIRRANSPFLRFLKKVVRLG